MRGDLRVECEAGPELQHAEGDYEVGERQLSEEPCHHVIQQLLGGALQEVMPEVPPNLHKHKHTHRRLV